MYMCVCILYMYVYIYIYICIGAVRLGGPPPPRPGGRRGDGGGDAHGAQPCARANPAQAAASVHPWQRRPRSASPP